jgi:uncharacterized protein YbdZ (MbtH family)
MAWDETEDTTIYKVVVNHEEQYSIWPADRENPLGWRDVGKTGLKAECLAYIEEVWTDMRPLSLRKQMEDIARQPAPPPSPSPQDTAADTLVQRLASGHHRIAAGLSSETGVQRLRQEIDRGYVHITFTDTRGGTELGIRLNPDASDVTQADFEKQTGSVHLEGSLVLDYVPVRCIADIDLTTLTGQGHLEIVAEST